MNARAMPQPAAATTRPAFGTVLASTMAVASWRDGKWSAHELRKYGPIELTPAIHGLHYGSTCFEGFKAYRWADGSINIFRMDKHVARLRQSAKGLCLPVPDAAQVTAMVTQVVDRVRNEVPEAPGALYLRPMLFGTGASIGGATSPATEAMMIVLASPVWDYFTKGPKPLRIYVEEQISRTATLMGMIKTGGNYAAALAPTVQARQQFQADQVVFCPGGQVQETGAANFLLIRDGRILTRALDPTILHGVTRDSLLTIAPDMGLEVEERIVTTDEMFEWVKDGEAALCGTAAVLSGVGTLVRSGGREYKVGSGEVGPNTRRLRAALVAMQQGEVPTPAGWTTRV
ncbi:MAG TPA: branched-chain amino acid aminotransferase [Steroidobacteraceae bacterium]|nr:branched-chain amino acid aminotransferase [Steroidobacteraceae bacterium]